MTRYYRAWTTCICLLLVHSVKSFAPNPDCAARTAGCFSECENDRSFELSWKSTANEIDFTLKYAVTVTSPVWIAFALSTDQTMGTDIVFECITDGTNSIIQRSRNAEPKGNTIFESSTDAWITQKSFSNANGVLTCSFRVIKDSTSLAIANFNSGWYVFFGNGAYSGAFQGGFKSKHSTTPKISSEKIEFQSAVGDLCGAGQNVMLKLHGIMMISSWVLCASIGIVVARYYKPVWQEQKLLGEKVWFTIHRSIMVLAVMFCIAGFVIIFVDRKKFQQIISDSDFKKAHPFIGLIVMLFALVQPIMAVCRPHPGEKNRFIFNWAHWAVGVVAHILAVLNIVIGVLLDPMELPLWVVYIVVAYAVYQIVIELFLEIYDCIDRFRNSSKRSDDYEMREESSLKRENKESKFTFKKIVLGLHFIIIIAFATTLIVLIVLDPSTLPE